MEIEKHVETVRPSTDVLWFFDYVRENQNEFIDIFSYTEETYVANNSIQIETSISDDGLIQTKKIYFKDYNVYDQWQNDPTIQLIVAKQRQYDLENGIGFNFVRTKDILTDVIFFQRER